MVREINDVVERRYKDFIVIMKNGKGVKLRATHATVSKADNMIFAWDMDYVMFAVSLDKIRVFLCADCADAQKIFDALCDDDAENGDAE